MERMKFPTFALFCCLALLLATPAFGYVDPNATGLITQVLGPVLVIAATGAAFLRKQIGAAFGWIAARVSPKNDGA